MLVSKDKSLYDKFLSWSRANKKVSREYIKISLDNSHAKWGSLGKLNGIVLKAELNFLINRNFKGKE